MSKRSVLFAMAAALTLGATGLQAATSVFPSHADETRGAWWLSESTGGAPIGATSGARGSIFPSASNETGAAQSAAATGSAGFRTSPASSSGAFPRGRHQHARPVLD